MRVLAAALPVLLLVAICSLAEADLRVARSAALSTNEAKSRCCFSYISHPIRRSSISSAYMTSKACPTPAVVLITSKGNQVCADPNAPWVQKYLKHLELLEY
ncbi:C-C motif chemokine 3-like [Anomalospiza imberbis]|uniref:C-C motif chemokine 3-like n=1 Tax=Anomalospiza imberbis TaxID=187417 RepID=UPI00358EAD0E